MAIKFLHTNDTHGTLTHVRAESLLDLREQADLYVDSGDCIKTGNLGVPLRPEPVWGELARLRCTASTIGNRETHIMEGAFRAKLQGAAHPILCANLRHRDGTRPLLRSLELEINGLQIGLFGVMVPMVTERMRTKAASVYLWDPPLVVAQEVVEELRPRVELLVALTHIGHSQDRELAERCPGIDIVFGGHSHSVLEEPDQIGDTWVCQGGSHSRFVGLYEWSGRGELKGGLRPFPER